MAISKIITIKKFIPAHEIKPSIQKGNVMYTRNYYADGTTSMENIDGMTMSYETIAQFMNKKYGATKVVFVNFIHNEIIKEIIF